MGSTAISAQGSKFEINTAAAGADDPVWTRVKNIKSFTGFDGTSTEIDKTDLDSDGKEVELGLPDWGNFSLDANINYDDPGQSAMQDAYLARSAKQYRLTLPNGMAKQFDAFVKSFPLAGGVDALMTGTIALRITGTVTTIPAGA